MGVPAVESQEPGSGDGHVPVVTLRLFASARQAAGTARAELAAATVGDVLRDAERRYGEAFARVLAGSRVWVNGAPADAATTLAAGDEVAVLPPVSGGAVAAGSAGPAGGPATSGEPAPR